MFILYIIVGAIVFAAGIGILYSIGWALKKMFPHSIFLDDDEPVLDVLCGLMVLLITALVVMTTYFLGAGVFSLFTGGK